MTTDQALASEDSQGPPHPLSLLVARPHHTALSCRDWVKTKSFFVDLLGFQVIGEIDRREEPALSVVSGVPNGVCRFAMLERGGYHVELLKWISPEGRDVDIRQNDIGIVHIAIEVSDAQAARNLLLGEGYETISDVQSLRGGRARVFYCKGPEGIIVEFLELVPEQSWSESSALKT
ncbi:MAG: glyoxalase/bleomycin resistance/dioxygenase family protein [Bradyrhizobiaceae bacterium]|nr:MAG: glyoxalase/bleomycin resistance/dioxygenase family protein [Bradyrhizobiaceae bacterium]